MKNLDIFNEIELDEIDFTNVNSLKIKGTCSINAAFLNKAVDSGLRPIVGPNVHIQDNHLLSNEVIFE